MSISKSLRTTQSNIEIHTPQGQIATIYQRDGFLRVKDILHDIELCYAFNKPDNDATLWQPALFSKDGSIIILDQQDTSEFPSPLSGTIAKYDFIYHSRCERRDLVHSLKDTCIKTIPAFPDARPDPRYLPIGKGHPDPRYSSYPTRSSSKRRSASSSQTSSQSPTRTDSIDRVEMPRIVTVRDASQLSSRVSSFREDVWRLSKRGCAVTREGDVDGTPCPGFEAAHIVPQSQWMVFPMDDNQNIADPTDQSSLNRAWLDTWTPERNGIMLDSTLHKCFDQRLWSIHPEKRKLRVFIDIPYLHKFHGQTVYLSKYTEDKVLQHHYDMCVLENMVIPEVPNPLKLTNTPSLAPRPMKYLKTFDTDPSKQSSNLGTPSFPGVPSFPGGSSSGTPSSGGNAFFPPSRQAAAHPPSPPLSKPGSEERILWPYNEDTNKVPSTAQQSIEDISDDDGQRRGRSRKKRRCTSSEVGDNWVAKWQRLE